MTRQRHRVVLGRRLTGMLRVMVAMLALTSQISLAQTSAKSRGFDDALYPPWQQGRNNDALQRGVPFTVHDADNLADFHGDPLHPKLVLFVGGNYFFAMAPLVQAFEARFPEFKGALYWETLPPGLLIQQIKNGGTITVGNMTWSVAADVYLAGLTEVQRFVDEDTLQGPAIGYVSNTLTIMVAKGNPKHIGGLTDLARGDVQLAMPNPQFEGVARQIRESLVKAGGEALATRIYLDKVHDGSAELTQIHHRQTPLWIMQNRADAGVTWQSEAVFQEQAGHAIAHVAIADAENTHAIYGGAMVKGAPHAEAARLWLDFIRSKEAIEIFEHYGFESVAGS